MNEALAPTPTDELWQEVRPWLDDAMHALKEEDRTAVVLRYFEDRSLQEVGAQLGVSENAARMRVDRALERLQLLLARRGIKSAESGLIAALAVGAAITAPAALCESVSSASLSAAGARGTSIATMGGTWAAVTAKLAVAGALVVAASALIVWPFLKSPPTTLEPVAPWTSSVVDPARTDGIAGANEDGASIRQAALSAPAMTLELLDAESGQPLPDARLYMFYMFEDGRGKVLRAVVNEKGKFPVALPQPPYRGLNLFVTAEGHVPKVTSWGFRREMPAHYTMKMERGISVAGRVVDEAGRPIEGAALEFDASAHQIDQAENIQFGPDTGVVTDNAGHWSCDMVPKDCEKLSLRVTHPDYAESITALRPSAADRQDYTII